MKMHSTCHILSFYFLSYPQRDRSQEKSQPPPPPAPAPAPEHRGSAFEAYRYSAAPPQSSSTTSTSSRVISQNGRPTVETFKGDVGQEVDEKHTVVEGGVLESRDMGVSIVIPKGAIPGDAKQEIYFKVCRDNSFLPPLDKDKGVTLLSPLVMCGPHGLRFNTPVEFRLPHCASVNPESWSFSLKSSDSPSGQPTKWQNMSLAGMEGVTQGHVSKNSVSVLVDHF